MEAMAAIPSLIGAGGSLAALLRGSPAENVRLPPQFTMPYMGETASNAYGQANAFQQMPNWQNMLMPSYQNILDRTGTANPGAGTALQGANDAAGLGRAAAGNQFNLGQFLTNQGQSFMPTAGALLNTAFDPQHDLYNRTQHNLQEQTRASSSARGLGMSPFAAGLENKAMGDFNIDWNNAQLQRQLAGAQGAGGVLQTGGNMIGAGSNMMSGAPGLLQQTSMFPYTANQGMNTDYTNMLNTFGAAGNNALVQPQQAFNNYMQYLSAGNQAGSVANQQANTALNQANLGFNQNQTLGQNFGRSMAGLFGQPGGGAQSGFQQMANGWGNQSNGSMFPSASFMSNGFGFG